MYDAIEAGLDQEISDEVRAADIASHQAEAGRLRSLLEVSKLLGLGVEGVEGVEPNHLSALRDEGVDERRSDEARGAGHQNGFGAAHGPSRGAGFECGGEASALICSSSRPIFHSSRIVRNITARRSAIAQYPETERNATAMMQKHAVTK